MVILGRLADMGIVEKELIMLSSYYILMPILFTSIIGYFVGTAKGSVQATKDDFKIFEENRKINIRKVLKLSGAFFIFLLFFYMVYDLNKTRPSNNNRTTKEESANIDRGISTPNSDIYVENDVVKIIAPDSINKNTSDSIDGDLNNISLNKEKNDGSIIILSPNEGDIFRIGQRVIIMWQNNREGITDDVTYDIFQIINDSKSHIASINALDAGCTRAPGCSYTWIPENNNEKYRIYVLEVASNRIGYSDFFSVDGPPILKPYINNINPSDNSQSNKIIIKGNNLSNATNLVFSVDGRNVASSGVSAISVNTDNKLIFNVDYILVSPGNYKVSVLTPAGYSNSLDFTIFQNVND